MKTFVRLVFGIVFPLLYTAHPLLAGPPEYQIFDLGTLGGSVSVGYAINDAGQVTGYSNLAGDNAHHAFLYNGTMSDLGTLGGTSSEGYSINTAGQVVGESDTLGDSAVHAFLFSGNSMTNLGTLGGDNLSRDSHANAINDSGLIVGDSYVSSPGNLSHAFLYLGSAMNDLGTLGGDLSSARGINASGQITGESDISTNNGVYHAFLYANGAMTNLGTLGGNSQGNAINSSGQIAGDVEVNVSGPSADWHAFLYANGTMTDLGTLGGNQSYGNSINDSGQVTGYSFLSVNPGQRRAFLYMSGSMYDLNTLAAGNMGGFDVLNYGGGINNNGWIAGYGVIQSTGQIHAFIAKPLDGTGNPTLSVRLETGKAILSWNASATGFILESSLSLEPVANWQGVTNSPSLVNGQYRITNDIAASTGFYRLRKP